MRGGSNFEVHQGALELQFCLSSPFLSSDEVCEGDSEDPQVYESMCNIQSQAGSSEAAQTSEPGNARKPTSPR